MTREVDAKMKKVEVKVVHQEIIEDVAMKCEVNTKKDFHEDRKKK